MRRYILLVIGGALSTVAFAIAINWLIDPYGIWRPPQIAGLNVFKPALSSHVRIFEIASARRLRPQVVILGTSRADGGLDPKHKSFNGERVFNLAGPLQLYEETAMLFEWATGQLGTKRAVVVLDFFAANANLKLARDYDPDNLRPSREHELLASLDTLVDSIKTATGQKAAQEEHKWHHYREDGLRMTHPDKVNGKGGHRKLFRFVESTYMNEVFLPPPECSFSFSNTKRNRHPMEELQKMLRHAYMRDIDVKLAISPVHARFLEAINSTGLWKEWEDWKRRLVAINAAEARLAGKSPFPFIDFSGYNEVTTESVPQENSEMRMHWYWEGSHYKQSTGDRMLAELLGEDANIGSPASRSFGVHIFESNLEQHLASTREGRTSYTLKFPAEVAEVRELASKAVETRQSLGCKK